MPTSYAESITPTIRKVEELAPKSILDVGCGFGQYGLLFREYLDICKHRYFPQDWELKLHAVEVYYKYLTPVHRHIYNEIFVGDFLNLKFDYYDLVFMGDVIEHFRRKDIVPKIEGLEAKHILITTPINTLKAMILPNNYLDNKNERHIHLWGRREFDWFDNWQVAWHWQGDVSRIVLLKRR